MRKWISPDQARPVQGCQSVVRSSPTFPLDRTGLSPTADRDRLDWWNHWLVLWSVSTILPPTSLYILRFPGAQTYHYCLKATVQALYGSEQWWYLNEGSRQNDLQLLRNPQARSPLGALPTTPRGALMRHSELTPAAVALEARQQ
jgi:hypothetical protein